MKYLSGAPLVGNLEKNTGRMFLEMPYNIFILTMAQM